MIHWHLCQGGHRLRSSLTQHGVSRGALNFRWEFEVVCTIVKNQDGVVYNIIGLCLRLTFDVAHHPVTNDITSVSSTQLDMLRFYWIHESNDLDLYIYNRSCWEIFTISKIICIHDIDNRSIYRYIYRIYMYIGLGLSSAIAILRSGFIRCCQMALRVVEDGLLHGGPPCSSWIWINKGTSLRSRDRLYGDEQQPSVRLSNLTFGIKQF